jgi:alpha-tubulin suppressor-like RCC1 family protein
MNPIRLPRALLAFALCAAAACDRNPVDKQVVEPAPLRFASVSVGQDGGAVCALSTEGAAYCWGGTNYSGNLGTGSVDSSQNYYGSPVRVTGGLRFRSIAPGTSYTCGTTADAALYCWGSDRFFTGNDTARVPAPMRVAGPRLAEVKTGGHGAALCGLSPEGAASCADFGGGAFANAAPGYTFSAYSRYLVSVPLRTPSRGWSARAYYHECGIRDGTLLCWGDNWHGELGNGTVAPTETSTTDTPVRTTTPAPVASSLKFRSVGTAWNHTCAVATDDSVWCWGMGLYGKLGTGDGPRTAVPVPTRVAGDLRLRTLSVGNEHACGVAADASAYCWGANDRGQLGNSGIADSSDPPAHNRTPVRVSGEHRWKQISAGQWVTCGVTEAGDVYCWGWGKSGTLGQGTLASSAVPVKVVFPT